jgi:hypothetical protein
MQNESDYLWDPSSEPDAEIARLERALIAFRHQPGALHLPRTTRRPVVRAWKVAAAVVLVAGASSLGYLMTRTAPWSVEVLEGNARADGTPLRTGERTTAGERIETGTGSLLRLAVGRIGIADLVPNSRLRLVSTGESEHRLRLERGTVYVTIWARPRFFVVETPKSTFVDLGCVYSLRVDSTGATRLIVRQGEVEAQASGRSLIVTAGTVVDLDSTGNAGVPYPVGDDGSWRTRVNAVASGETADSLLTPLLRSPHGAEVIALWHLTWRASPAMRGRIYDALTPVAPLGASVRREDVVRLDPTAMEQWRNELRPLWTLEPATWWGRVLLRFGFRKPAVPLATLPAG